MTSLVGSTVARDTGPVDNVGLSVFSPLEGVDANNDGLAVDGIDGAAITVGVIVVNFVGVGRTVALGRSVLAAAGDSSDVGLVRLEG